MAARRDPGQAIPLRGQLPYTGLVSLTYGREPAVDLLDLYAPATGQPADLDSELCAVVLSYVRDRLAGVPSGPGAPFGPEQPVPPGASAADQLAGCHGRKVA